MNRLAHFDIEIVKLNEGTHEFDYTLDDTFFGLFTDNLVEKGQIKASIKVVRSYSMLECTFHFKGEIELICDRSLEPFQYPIDSTHHLIFKFGDAYEELSDEIVVIDRNAPKINIASYLNEFVGLSVPMKKLHPKFREEDEAHEDDYLVYTTKKEGEEEEDPNDFVDPRWLALNKLKKDENNN